MKSTISLIPATIIAIMAILTSGTAISAPGARTILSTTFPIHLITGAVTAGDAGVANELLLSPNLGCPHSYVVTPQDMRRIGSADVIVYNGLGLDDELVAAKNRAAASKAVLIDSSAGLAGSMEFKDDDGHDGHDVGHHDKHDDHHDCEHEGVGHGGHDGHDDHGDARHDGAAHEHAGINPHMFASPLMAAAIANNIARQLGVVRPASAELYLRNAAAFEKRMRALNDEMKATVQRLKSRKIVTQHGAFDYLARDVGLEIVTVVEAHPGTEPSAAEMMKIVKQIRHRKAAAIYIEPQYPPRVPKTIAAEAGIPVGTLDPVATGPAGADASYYEKIMRENMRSLEKSIGTR